MLCFQVNIAKLFSTKKRRRDCALQRGSAQSDSRGPQAKIKQSKEECFKHFLWIRERERADPPHRFLFLSRGKSQSASFFSPSRCKLLPSCHGQLCSVVLTKREGARFGPGIQSAVNKLTPEECVSVPQIVRVRTGVEQHLRSLWTFKFVDGLVRLYVTCEFKQRVLPREACQKKVLKSGHCPKFYLALPPNSY